MNSKIVFFASLVLLSSYISADTSDYVWNEQFSKKIAEAEAGKMRSQYDVGNMYLKGQGTGFDEAKAFTWFTKAAQSGHVKSQFKIGFMLLNGAGVKKDYAKAEKWLRKAANKKYAPAEYYLAGMYRDGKYLSKNYDKSLFWLKRAKASGFWKAATEYDKVIALVQRNNSRTSKAVTPRATPKSKPKLKRVVVSDDLRDLLLNASWFEGRKPARYLPSSVTQCEKKRSGLACASMRDINGKRGNTTFKYRIVATLKNISESGEFSVIYNNNVLSVIPGAPLTIPGDDDEEPPTIVPSPVVKLGFQRTVHNLDCQLVNSKQINCVKDYGRSIKLTRK